MEVELFGEKVPFPLNIPVAIIGLIFAFITIVVVFVFIVIPVLAIVLLLLILVTAPLWAPVVVLLYILSLIF